MNSPAVIRPDGVSAPEGRKLMVVQGVRFFESPHGAWEVPEPINRWRAAWLVLSGQADVLVWPT